MTIKLHSANYYTHVNDPQTNTLKLMENGEPRTHRLYMCTTPTEGYGYYADLFHAMKQLCGEMYD